MQSEEQQLGKKVNRASAACEDTLKGSESQKKTKGLAQEKIFEEWPNTSQVWWKT